MKGKGNKNYFLRVIDMRNYFLKIWGKPRLISFPAPLKYGIVYQNGLENVTGHVDVFFDKESGGAAYLYYSNKKYANTRTELWKYGK